MLHTTITLNESNSDIRIELDKNVLNQSITIGIYHNQNNEGICVRLDVDDLLILISHLIKIKNSIK